MKELWIWIVQKWLEEEPVKPLDQNVLLLGKSGTKFNEQYFFVMDGYIFDKHSLTPRDEYGGSIKAVNYMKSKRVTSNGVLTGSDLKETMKLLETENEL